jgi:uncharacterized protein YdhG (YjbR/CyaY superfamily)
MADALKPENMDEYIAGFPENMQEILEKIRLTIRKAAPEAVETIKYDMPTFTLKGNLVYFSAFKNHIGFYPPISGSLRFPLDQPIPYDLIRRIVAVRVKENLEKAEAKAKKKK